ncbi:hypothetical protein ACPOM7_24800 [Peribacillus castrilensis]
MTPVQYRNHLFQAA